MDFNHLAPSVLEKMTLPDAERIDSIDSPFWVDYSAGSRLIDHLASLLRVVPQTRMPNLFIVGDSNYGKSTLFQRFRDTRGCPYVSSNLEPVIPVVLIELDTGGPAQLYRSILHQIGAPYSRTSPLAAVKEQCAEVVRDVGTRMLIIDECQVLNFASARAKADVMNEIKWICNQLRLVVVCAGVKTILQLLNIDAQYASRFDVIDLLPWELDGKFQAFLKKYETALPLRKPSLLYSEESTVLIHDISGGLTGNVGKLLKECAKEAIRTGSEKIDMSLLKKNEWIKPNKQSGNRVIQY